MSLVTIRVLKVFQYFVQLFVSLKAQNLQVVFWDKYLKEKNTFYVLYAQSIGTIGITEDKMTFFELKISLKNNNNINKTVIVNYVVRFCLFLKIFVKFQPHSMELKENNTDLKWSKH